MHKPEKKSIASKTMEGMGESAGNGDGKTSFKEGHRKDIPSPARQTVQEFIVKITNASPPAVHL